MKLNKKKEEALFIGDDGKPMTIWQIWLRRLCMVMLIWSGLEIIASAFAFTMPYFNGRPVQELLLNPGQKIQISMLGLTALFGVITDIFVGFLGIRGAKNPSKIALFFWITLIDAVITAWALASSISEGSVEITSLISSLFILTLATCAWMVRGQTGYFDKHPTPEKTSH